VPSPFLFDYQAGVARLAHRKGKLGAFVRCGRGKTLIFLECARHWLAQLPPGRRVLILSPAMVVDQTCAEAAKFYGMTLPVEAVAAKDLSAWLTAGGPGRIGIASYNALGDDTPRGNLGALILDESSMLKSQYGTWGQHCIRLGKGLAYKLALTGTPAPNDRIEFANHAVLMDAYPTVNSFLARFFVNRGQTDNRWEMKPHATGPFYRALSHWSIFLNSPATYGWRDNAGTIPPIRIHVDDVPLTAEQKRIAQDATGMLIAGSGTAGGITSRSTLAQLAKGTYKGAAVPTAKPEFIRQMVASWPNESTIVWCHFNAEQDSMEAAIPGAATIRGATPHARRLQLIDDFKAGRVKVLISKPDVLGLGLNLQVATRHVFSGLQDSYEDFHQAVCRSNRVGSTRPLDVHIPVTSIERPMIDIVLAKADRVDADNAEQERIFKENARDFLDPAA
jgi:superfamily II DNA or RNA helicase